MTLKKWKLALPAMVAALFFVACNDDSVIKGDDETADTLKEYGCETVKFKKQKSEI